MTAALLMIWISGTLITAVTGVMLMFLTDGDKEMQRLGKTAFLGCPIWPLTLTAAIIRKLKEIK